MSKLWYNKITNDKRGEFMKVPVDLRTEMKKNEAEFYNKMDELSASNYVAVAMLDSLQNDNYNGIIVNAGYERNGSYFIELANVLNPMEQYSFRLGRIKPARAERFKIGALVNMHWENGRADPVLNIGYNSKKSSQNLKMLGQLINCTQQILEVLDTQNEDYGIYNVLDAVTVALDNYYYNLEFNDVDYNLAISNQIAELVKFQTLGVFGDLEKYASITSTTLNTISAGLKQGFIEEVPVNKTVYNASIGVKYNDFNKNIDKPELFFYDSRTVRSLSDMYKLKRLDSRLKSPEVCVKSSIPEILKRDGKSLSYLVIADCKRTTERGSHKHYLHLLCLDSFSRDFLINVDRIENSERLGAGSIFNAETLIESSNGKMRFVNVECITPNDAKTRLDNIMSLKNLIDVQRKYVPNLTGDDLDDLNEADEYILLTLRQYCSEIGLDDEKRREFVKLGSKYNSKNNDTMYNKILGIAKDSISHQNTVVYQSR